MAAIHAGDCLPAAARIGDGAQAAQRAPRLGMALTRIRALPIILQYPALAYGARIPE